MEDTPTYRMLDGKRVPLAPHEQAAIVAEWEATPPVVPPTELETAKAERRAAAREAAIERVLANDARLSQVIAEINRKRTPETVRAVEVD